MKYFLFASAFLVLCNVASGSYYGEYDKKACRVAWCYDCTLDPLVCKDCIKGFYLTLNGLCSEHYEDSIEYRTKVGQGSYGYSGYGYGGDQGGYGYSGSQGGYGYGGSQGGYGYGGSQGGYGGYFP